MKDRTKRKREEGIPQEKLNFSNKYWNDRFALLFAEFEGSVNKKSIKDVIVESVIKEERDHYTKIFNEMKATCSGEDSSDDSVDSYLSPYFVRTERELKQRRLKVEDQREGLRHMLDNKQIHMVGTKVFSPLGKDLPDDKGRWMDHPEIKESSFEPSKHSESGLCGSHGFLEHLKRMQQSCLYHRGLLL